MQNVTPRVYTDTTQRGCNPSFVVTSDGVVVIDTPQLPTKAVAMRREAEAHGPVRYVINTEHHVDHIFGNYYFRGAGPVIAHAEVAANFMLATQHPSPYEYAREALPTDDPDGVAIFPDEETYFRDPNRPAITFTQDLTLKVGGHTFELMFTPGHTVGQIAVHVPEERVVFTGDTIFCECQTWLYVSNVDQWLAALERIRALDVDHVVPGHGPVTTKAYIDVQRAFLLEWVSAVASGVAKGWTKEECIARISFADRFPVDIGQEYMMGHIQRENVSALYDKLLAGRRP
ncbi:MAG: MBL fold metallo-hydrolase [Thermoanaerobaculaceae bacterium]|nr:MBL fold metallo-hydrolase [Thermoanaerobaculaceae bacterium]